MRVGGSRRGGKWNRRRVHPLVIIVPVLLLAFGIAILIGNILNNNQALRDSLLERETDLPEDEIVKTDVPDKHIMPHEFGYALTRIESDSASVMLRDINGTVVWNSPTASATRLGASGEIQLSSQISYLKENGFYVSGCFYSTWQEETDVNVQKIMREYEIALLSEIASAKVDDVVILGLVINAETEDDVCEFLKSVKTRISGLAIGVAMTPDAAEIEDNGNYFAARIRKYCDFLALDLRVNSIIRRDDGDVTVEWLYSKYKYYAQRFSMRLIFDENTAPMADSADKYGIKSWQIIE